MNFSLLIIGFLLIFIGVSLMFDEEPNPDRYRFKLMVIEALVLILFIIEIYNY